MKTDNWYKTWFSSKDYLALYKHRDSNDAKRINTLLFKNIKLKRSSKILDLACGNGRHSILFAKKGYNVTGVDLSKFLIEQAKKKLNKEYVKYKDRLNFVIKDMRNIGYNDEFDLVVNLFTSFGYFNENRENEKVIKEISKALKPGGHLLFDFLNSTYLKKHIVPFDTKNFDSRVAVQIRSIKKDVVIKEIYILSKRKPKHYYPEIFHFTERIKLYNLNDFKKMFSKFNLKIIKTFGDYEGSNYRSISSQRLIIIAKKKRNL